jgi:hypothetical protein
VCKRVFALTDEYWYRDTAKPGGYRYDCKQCAREYAKLYAARNRAKFRAYSKRHYTENKAKVLAAQRQYRAAHALYLKVKREGNE